MPAYLVLLITCLTSLPWHSSDHSLYFISCSTLRHNTSLDVDEITDALGIDRSQIHSASQITKRPDI